MIYLLSLNVIKISILLLSFMQASVSTLFISSMFKFSNLVFTKLLPSFSKKIPLQNFFDNDPCLYQLNKL